MTMDVSVEVASQQQQQQQQRQQSSSPKKSYGVLRSILPNRENRRSETQPETDYRTTHSTQTVPILPPDHPHAPSKAATDDARMGRPSSRSKENTAPPKHARSKSTVSLRSLGRSKDKDKDRDGEDKKDKKSRRDKDRQAQPDGEEARRRFKKTKSTTSLRGLFTKNRSSKDLSQIQLDKENQTPSPVISHPVDTPIWSQFATAPAPPIAVVSDTQVEAEIARYTPINYSPSKQRDFSASGAPTLQRPPSSDRPTSSARPTSASRPKSSSRPKSMVAASTSVIDIMAGRGSDKPRPTSKDTDRPRPPSSGRETQRQRPTSSSKDNRKPSTDQPHPSRLPPSDRNVSFSSNEQGPPHQTLNVNKRGSRVMAAVAAWNGKTQESVPLKDDSTLDPKSVDAAFEAVLDSRNIPENMRQRMRTLTLRVKADFVKQDRGAATPSSPIKSTSKNSLWAGQDSVRDQSLEPGQDEPLPDETLSPETKKSRSRSKTFTFTKSDGSPSKKQKPSSRPNSIHIPKSTFDPSSGLPSPRTPSGTSVRGPQPADPEEFVVYLKTVRDPTKVEVGRLHKLRLLLRNETVAWVDYFISLGGMTEVIDLLHRIIAVEWREEHEDQLLHETLLCLKGLCTTEVALVKLEAVADTLFESLLGLLFDEEKKGPNEFNTRAIIINILFAYLSATSCQSPEAMAQRARAVLVYLTGPKKPEEAQPVSFVLEMQQPRPYRVWCNEVNNVTREVFWIFLHHLNIIPLPKRDLDGQKSEKTSNKQSSSTQPRPRSADSQVNGPSSLAQSYTKRHFPGNRPPVPAAPYIGGVEWDATTYMAAHLDLLNGLIASLPTQSERNALRSELQASGWEKVMGTTLRTCKEKFYCGVHDGLQRWVAAADEDGWPVRLVRYGPSQEELAQMSPRKSPKKAEAPPKLEAPVLDIPKLSIGLGGSGVLSGGDESSSFGYGKHDDDDDDGWLL